MQSIRVSVLLAIIIAVLSSCDHNVTSETFVHPDGSLDKVFVFENNDSSRNIVGLNQRNGWTKSVVAHGEHTTKTTTDKYTSVYKKSFTSAEALNKELSSQNDSLLRMTSTFEKSFRWFYTHIRYTETIHALNNLRLKQR